MTKPHALTHIKRPYRSKEQWRQLIDEFEASDLSVNDYCAQNNIKHTTFYIWRKRLQQPPASNESPSFVELTELANTAPNATNQSNWDIELQLDSTMFLRIRKA